MDQLREEIEQGSYRVDPKAVADAIMLRILGPTSGSGADATVVPIRTSARSPITGRSRR
jgi:Anti-sigma-28 factor, FlgM